MCPQNSFRAIGIDLGTTNSTVAEVILKQGEPPVCRTLDLDQPTREGVYTSPLVPSVVAILPDGTVWVGEGAKRLRAFPHEYDLSFEKTLFYDTKNEMGLRKTYHRAAPEFNHASKIAAQILRFLATASRKLIGAVSGAGPESGGGSRDSSTKDDFGSDPNADTKSGSGADHTRGAEAGGSDAGPDTASSRPSGPGNAAAPATSDAEKAAFVSVTVPASFQLNQRRDTLLAARSAGLPIADDDLLDEPTAALTDFILTNGVDALLPPSRTGPSLCVVFDFGGGTCDVSVIQISRTSDAADSRAPKSAPFAPSSGSPSASTSPLPIPAAYNLPSNLAALSLSPLSISRYHRLGGGDIDTAIVHEVLIPALLAENGLSPLDLTWAQKKKGLEPQLLGKAEALKIALCREIERLIKFGKYNPSAPASDPSDKSSTLARQPSLACVLGDRTLRLSQPSLSALDFEKLLAPFLDADFLYASETEYRLSQSVLAPLEDALSRADRSPSDVDVCLLVGGSTLIPQVRDALRAHFPNARLAQFASHLDTQLAVARGAAWNAAIKAATGGRPLIQPVLHDGIALVTAEGRLDVLIPSGTALPFPPDGSLLSEKLMVPTPAVPQAADFPRELRFEVVGQEDRRHIFDAVWPLPEGVAPGDEIVLEYRFTSGKQFECRASFPKRPSRPLEQTVENPLVNVANPNALQVRIEDVEEKLRRREIRGAEAERDAYFQLAQWYAELKQLEKALDYLRTAQTRVRTPDAEILNLQGVFLMDLGDSERGRRAFLDAERASPGWGGPMFNLALNLRHLGRPGEALEALERASRDADIRGPVGVLQALCLDSLGRSDEARAAAAAALASFLPLILLDEFSLGWYRTAARMAGDKGAEDAASRVLKDRRKRSGADAEADAREGIPRPALWGDKESRKPS